MIPLSSLSRGSVICLHVEGDGPEATRLKRMGICSGRQIEVVHAGDPMILRVVGVRIGLSKQLAGIVFVEPTPAVVQDQRADSGGHEDDRQ